MAKKEGLLGQSRHPKDKAKTTRMTLSDRLPPSIAALRKDHSFLLSPPLTRRPFLRGIA
jgi:hypothetical protein